MKHNFWRSDVLAKSLTDELCEQLSKFIIIAMLEICDDQLVRQVSVLVRQAGVYCVF